MQIGHQVLNRYEGNIQDNVRLEHAKTAEQSGIAKSSADISGLKEGAVFRGEVMDIAGEKVTIALENRAQLIARLQAGVELGVGDQLLFSVKENTASQILIKPLFDSLYSAQTQVLEKALDMAGLSPTEKNFSAAKELMEAGLPVDKGNLVKLLSQSMKFEGTSMQTLTVLNKMNIPVTAENIAQYERYQSYNHQLMGDISQTADSMAEFTKVFPEGTSGNTLLSVASELVDIFMSEESGNTAELVKNGDMLSEAALINEQNPENTGTDIIQKETNTKAMPGTEFVSENGELQTLQDEAANNLQAEGKLQKSEDNPAENLTRLSEKFEMSKESLNQISGMMEKSGVTREQVQNLLHNSGSQEELLKNMLQSMRTGNGSDSAIRNMLESNEFKKLFSDMVKKGFSLNPKEMKDPKEIDELYDRILKQSKAFEDTIASKGGDTKNFNQNFQNMRQNMQFMNQLNDQMIYAQMPLKLSNQNANSELYVYADKRKLAEKKDGISVMLHLDMDHLGTTDIKVTLTGSNVNARFYLNDRESVDIVADNIGELARQLADRGFSLTNEVIQRKPQESINKVVDEIIDENAERSIKRYTFDART